MDKIKTICVNIEAGLDQETNPYTKDTATDKLMESFGIMSTSEIMEIIKKSPGKGCKSDPIPTDLLKKILPSCIDLIAEIVNQSLQIGIFPDRLKKALVKPLLKKINLGLIKKN